MNLQHLSIDIEALMVERNLRHMAEIRGALTPGYYLRAAQLLESPGTVLIATGFPVGQTFETDGPLGAIALYRSLEHLGARCTIACADPLAGALESDFRVLRLEGFDHPSAQREAGRRLDELRPDRIICIERPGLAHDGRYYNMRGVDISSRCAIFDYYVTAGTCPSIGIGDGGNEIGMGAVRPVVETFDIVGAQTSCDELLVADVSNWSAYGLITMLEALSAEPLLEQIDHHAILAYLSERGSVDGVTGENTLTEDGLPADAGAALLRELSQRLGEARADRSPANAAEPGG